MSVCNEDKRYILKLIPNRFFPIIPKIADSKVPLQDRPSCVHVRTDSLLTSSLVKIEIRHNLTGTTMANPSNYTRCTEPLT